MKIAYDAKRAFRNYSGLGNYSRTVINAMSKHFPKNQYYLYTPQSGYNSDDFPPENTRVVSPKNILDKKISSYWRSYKIPLSLVKEKIDIYHGLSHELPVNIRKSGVKSIVIIHDLIFFRYPELYKRIDRKIYRKKYTHAVNVADKILAISQQTKRDIVEFLNIDESRVEVIYQSSNPIFSSHLSNEKLVVIRGKYDLPSEFILSVGTIEKRKNLLELVKAVHKGKVNVPIVIVGREKKYAKEVYKYIADNKVSNIYFLRNVSNEDLPAIYQLADVFAYPSSFEGFGLPVLEAIQSGTPVIAGRGSCLEETGGPDSIYIDPFNTEEFSNAILKVFSNSDLKNRMKRKGLAFADNFKLDTAINTLNAVYESIY